MTLRISESLRERRRPLVVRLLALLLHISLAVLTFRTSWQQPPARPPAGGTSTPGVQGPGHSDPATRDSTSALKSPDRLALPEADSNAGFIRFSVRTVEGAPVDDAIVRVCKSEDDRRGAGIGSPIEGRTTADGTVVLSIPESQRKGRLLATAESRDGCLGTRRRRECAIGESVELVLQPCASVRGTVLGLDEEEAGRARILAFCPDWPESPGRRVIPVAEDGAFSIGGITNYVGIVAMAPGRVPSESWQGSTGQGTLRTADATTVTLTMGPRSTPLRLRFVRSGGPMPEGSRIAVGGSEGRGWIAAVVGEDGWTDVPGVEPGSILRLVAWQQPGAGVTGWETVKTEFRLEPSEWRSGMTLSVLPAINAEFAVTDPEGGVVRSMECLVGRGPDMADLVACRTDDGGRVRPFERRAFPEGDYSLTTRDGAVLWQGTITAGQDRPIGVRLPEALATVAVRLLDWSGNEVKCDNIAAALVPQDEAVDASASDVADRRYLPFSESSVVILHCPTLRVPGTVLRVRTLWHGTEDRPVHGNDRVDVVVPRDAGVVQIRFAKTTRITESLITMSRTQPGPAHFEIRLREGVAWLYGIPQGTYGWSTDFSNGPREYCGDGCEVVGGRITVLEVQ